MSKYVLTRRYLDLRYRVDVSEPRCERALNLDSHVAVLNFGLALHAPVHCNIKLTVFSSQGYSLMQVCRQMTKNTGV